MNDKKPKIGLCRLCLQTKQLCSSHIIPESFYDKPSVLITDKKTYPSRRPKGAYDNGILCKECDNDLGKLDQYAKETLIDKDKVSREIKHDPKGIGENMAFYRLLDKGGYNKITRFFISILWRASVASFEDFAHIKLGRYESIAKQAIYDQNYDFSKYFTVTLFFMTDIEEKVNLIGKRTHIDSVGFYIWTVGSIKAYIKCDQQKHPFPVIPDILMIESRLSEHPEYKILKDMYNKLAPFRKHKI